MAFDEANYENSVLALFQNMGYQYVYGPDLERDYKSPLYETVLEQSLHRLNPKLPEAAISDALYKLHNFENGTLVQKNTVFMNYLQNGIEVSYHENGETKHDIAYIADFENVDNNSFIVANQWTFIENDNNKRPDVLIFLNGLPVVLVELKSPSRDQTDASEAYLQIRNYMDKIPSMFIYNAICVMSDMFISKAGTITSGEDRYMEWKTTDGNYENTQFAQFDTFFEGIFDKTRFMDILKNFICFDADGTASFKILAAYHQYFAVRKAITSTVHAASKDGDGKGGVFWHTQGSGKSLSMVFYAHLLQKELDSPTIVVITDRNDLDNQLFAQFARCSDFLRQTPIQATSREHLMSWLNSQKANGIIFTTMQKFEESSSALSERKNIIVIADEAHRSQYGLTEHFKMTTNEDGEKVAKRVVGNARIIRDCLPNATFIGFTGTPVSSKDHDTQAVFGKYIDIYDMTQAVEDGATRPVYYESRVVNLEEIHQYIDNNSEQIGIIVVYLCERLLVLAQNEKYTKSFLRLIEIIKQFPHVVFVPKKLKNDKFSMIQFMTLHSFCQYQYSDVYQNDRDHFYDLKKAYDDRIFSLTENCYIGYFCDVLLPALFIANDAEWEVLLKVNRISFVHALRVLRNVISKTEKTQIILEGEELLLSNVSNDIPELYVLISNKRDILHFSECEFESFQKSDISKRAEFILKVVKERCVELDLLTKVIDFCLNDNDLSSRLENKENWTTHKFESFRNYRTSYFIAHDSLIHDIIERSYILLNQVLSEGLTVVISDQDIDFSRYFRENVLDSQNNVVFRRYVLDSQDFADEFEELIYVFQEYISKLRGIDITFEKSNTENGVVFTISSKSKKLVKDNFSNIVEDFMIFMSLCDREEVLAREMISSYELDDAKVDYYIAKFKTKARRIVIDYRHELELKLVKTRQEIELAAIEGEPIDFDVFPKIIPSSLPADCIQNYGTLYQIYNSPVSIVAGDYNYVNYDQELLDYINKYSENYEELAEQLSLLKEQEADQTQKQSAFTKLKSFLEDHAVEIGEAALRILLDYLMKCSQM